MHHKKFHDGQLYEPPKIRRVPYKKSRYVKYRPKTWEEWEQLED